MAIVLTDISAARLWEAHGALAGVRCSALAPEEEALALASLASPDEIAAARSLGVARCDEPLQALVSSPSRRSHLEGVKCASCTQPLPARSIYRVDAGVFVVSPGLCLASLARTFDIPSLAYVASLMCSIYAVDPLAGGASGELGAGAGERERSDEKSRLPRRTPLTTIEWLDDYLGRVSFVCGAPRARKALAFAHERARSPMEISLVLQLCLPYRYGGYGLPHPVLNAEVAFDDGFVLEPDLTWPKHRVAIEYLGESEHTQANSLRKDVHRSNRFAGAAFTVFALTKEHMGSVDLLERIVFEVARGTGKPIRPPKGFSEKRSKLRSQIIAVQRKLDFE